jgi:signal transduction histidine kinase
MNTPSTTRIVATVSAALAAAGGAVLLPGGWARLALGGCAALVGLVAVYLLRAGRQLELARAELAEEKERHRALHRIGERLAAESEVPALGEAILSELADFARADVGAFYAVDSRRRGGLFLLATRGLDPECLPVEVLPEVGLAGQALATGGLVTASDHSPGMRHEAHLPLRGLDRDVGVLTLGRTSDREFSNAELAAIEHLAGEAATALSHTLSYRAAQAEASVSRAVLDATPDGICLTDAAGKILLSNAPMNALAFDVLGLPRRGTIFERMIAAADRFTDPAGFRAAMAGLAADPQSMLLAEYELTDSQRTFQGYAAPVQDSAGRLTGRIFVLREVTAERAAERVKDEFVATVSHELRTPLAAMAGSLELILEGVTGDLNAEQRRFLGILDRSARRLSRLVGDLLLLGQIDADRLTLEREPVDLAKLATECVETSRALAESKSIALTYEGEPVPPLDGDPARLAQLLDNLVSNALKFTPSGGRVWVRARPDGDAAVLEVSDSGIGISDTDRERLFQRFFRAASATDHAIQGTGLGLAISRAIVEAHGGSIEVRSEEGVGTTFRIRLPLETPVAASRPESLGVAI